MIDYRILGPLEVSANGRLIEIGGPKLRALLIILLLRANESVPRDVLVHELWGEQPPAGAQHSLDVYVSRLRKSLDAAADRPVLVTRSGAYSLLLAEGQLDARRFEDLVGQGRTALAANAPGQAAEKLRAALELWRGQALADLANGHGPQVEAVRLEELRLSATEDRIDSDLALGRHAEVVGELEALVAVHPLRERLHGQLMIALYRSGRQAEALEAYQAARRTLVDELGLEPGPALQRLESAILRQDASLDPPGPATTAAGVVPVRGRRQPWLLGPKRLPAIAAALAVAIALLVAVTSRDSAQLVAGPDTVGVIDAGQARLSAVVTAVGRPNGVAYGAGAVWVTDSADNMLLRIDPAGQVNDRIPVGRGPAGVVVADGEVWVANELDGTVSEVNPGSGTQVAAVRVGVGPEAIAAGYGSVWVTNVTSDTLSRIDATTGDVVATISLGSVPDAIAVGDGGVWVTSQETGEVLRVDPANNRIIQASPVGQRPDGLAVGAGSVWVADGGGSLTRVDPRTGKVQTTAVSGAPAGIVYADDAVWVASSISGTVTRIDPSTGATKLIQVGNQPADLAAAGRDVWATVLPSLATHRGGTLTVIAQQVRPVEPSGQDTDPAVAYDPLTWQMLSMTNDGLVGYRRVGGLAGDQLVPDLATSLPRPADGGRTYTFRLRPGVRYSTGVLIRPDDIRRAIERVFVIDEQQDPSILPYYVGIVGASQCQRSRGPCDLSRGIVADDATGTITFHLTAPDPEFLYKLAFPWAYAVPPGTPGHPISAAQIPATGPYMIESLGQGHTWTLVRNPRFREWSQQAQPGGYPDRIVVRFDVGPGQAVADVEDGRADVLLTPPPDAVGQLAIHYPSQLHSGPLAATFALTLNTRIAPFNSPAARRALNDAIDRNTVIALNGGTQAAAATCQILPPTMPGYQPYCPYALQPGPAGAGSAPDMALAEQLVHASGTRGDTVRVLYGNQGTPFPTLATASYVVSVLDQLGYRASLRLVDPNAYWNVFGDSRDRVQIGFFGWNQDYPAPSQFVDPVLTCGSFIPANPGNLNTAEFCDPPIDTQAEKALADEVGDPATAAGQWAAIDHELVDQAPWVPLYNPRDLTVLSARTGNYQFHPYWNLLIDQLWVR
jgi:YVTN family beta-propeller protein